MAYNNMNTKFTDTRTGEEWEFLGTNITFSEKELLNLEHEYDEVEDKRLVARLISTGFFEEEWTDYYAETDAEGDEDEPGGDEAEVERVHSAECPSASDCVVVDPDDLVEAAEGTESQLNVPVFINEASEGKDDAPDFKDDAQDFKDDATDTQYDDTINTVFTFPPVVPSMATNKYPVVLPKVYDYDFAVTKNRCGSPPKSSPKLTNMKFFLRRLFIRSIAVN